MKVIAIFAVILAVALAAPQGRDADAQVVRADIDNIGVGGYRYSYETSNGLSSDEQGEIKNEGREDETLVVRGQFSYVGPDGVTYTVTYIADENGFQPQGAHIPQN
ncbi:flexible cuticle protein 12-like [Tribolium madens]|uniref:flexible cuticle protein 12-like n=1 Tax=Tribolium madens TaxID=41895 RepID=UPI001CF754D9|nr:flexible cuticle protein 12-like [Tribolium madens]